MGFPRIRLVEQTEQKFRRIRGCLKEKQNKTGKTQIGAISKAQTKSKGDPLETKKIQEKVAQCRKNRKGDHLHSSGFVGYV